MALISIYDYLPQRKLSLLDTSSQVNLFQAYSDNIIAINQWENQSEFSFRCNSQPGAKKAEQCGIDLFNDWDITKGIDLSLYDEVKVKMKYEGSVEYVRFFMRHHNPAYFKEGDANSNKYMSVELLTTEFSSEQTVSIPLHQLRVANWWLLDLGISRQFISPEFSNVITIGLDFSPHIIQGSNNFIDLESIVFVGPIIKQHHWYLGILIFWMLSVGLTAVSKYYVLLKTKKFFESESQRYQNLSNVDALTGALNRVGVEKNMGTMAAGKSQVDIGVIFIDVDHFKGINDNYGHDGGDIVLKTLVEIVTNHIRNKDIFGRWGGEEFVLILPDTDEEVALAVAEKIRRIIADHTFLEESLLKVTASFGISTLSKNDDFEEALKRADQALYQAKSSGRNCCVVAA